MKFYALSAFLFTAISLHAMEELANGTTRDQYITLQNANSSKINSVTKIESCKNNDDIFADMPPLVSDDHRSICMHMFNQRDAHVRTVLKKHRAEARAKQDQYVKELIYLESQKKASIEFSRLNNTSFISHADQDDDSTEIAIGSTIVKKQLLEEKEEHASQQVDEITKVLEEYDNRKEVAHEEWVMVDEAEDTSYLQLTIKERTFLIKYEEMLKKDANSFYNVYRLDRLSAKERHDILARHQKEIRNGRIKTGLGIGAGVAVLGTSAFAIYSLLNKSMQLESTLQNQNYVLDFTDKLSVGAINKLKQLDPQGADNFIADFVKGYFEKMA